MKISGADSAHILHHIM